MDHHEKLREKLDLFPIGLPRQDDVMKLLRILFPGDDARVAASVPNPPIMYGARRIASRAGMNRREVSRRLASMASRNLIIEYTVLGEKRYALAPAVPGFLEMQFMKNQEIDDDRREAGRLWHEALEGEFGRENYGYPTGGARVVPVRRSVDSTQRIFSFEEVEKIIRKSGDIALTECACRKSARKCDAPLDVCMMFGFMAQYLVNRNLAERITMRQAVKTLERAEDAGLVHTTTNSKPPVSIVCNCCSCCCASLRGVTGLNRPASSVASNFICRTVSGSNCRLCRACVKACPVEAVTIEDKKVGIDASKCIGCGICVSKCDTGSLKLVRRPGGKIPETPLHLTAKMYGERGKAPDVVRNLLKDML